MSEQEFNEKIVALKPMMIRFAMKLTKDEVRAEDLVQDTYVSMLQGYQRGNYAPVVNIKCWMFQIMKNNFINSYRARERRRDKLNTIPDLVAIQHLDQRNDYSDTESMVCYADVCERITKAAGPIRSIFLTPLQLYVDGYKYEEIAEMMNLDLGTVKSRIFLARKQLMKRFERN